jgi:hypothetical protein
MSTISGAPADCARWLGIHEATNGTAAKSPPIPAIPAVAVSSIRRFL